MNDKLMKQIHATVRQATTETAIFEALGRTALPVPADYEAERVVASAVLYGTVAPSTLPCRAWDFRQALCRHVFAYVEAIEELGQLDGEPDLRLIAKLFVRQGVPAARVLPELRALKWDVPVAYDLETLAERLCDVAAQRRTIELMRRLDTAWRTEGEVPPQLVPLLRDALRQWDESSGGPRS